MDKNLILRQMLSLTPEQLEICIEAETLQLSLTHNAIEQQKLVSENLQIQEKLSQLYIHMATVIRADKHSKIE